MNDTTQSPPSDLPADRTEKPVRYVSCPTCRKQVAWLDSEAWRPFCSRKCQLIDFGEWAAERHSIPADTPPDAAADTEPDD